MENNQLKAWTAKIPILSELLGEIPFGRAILILYDPDSQSTALFVNVSAEYLRAGGDVLHFAASEPVAELRQRFEQLGLNIKEYETKDSAVLFDAYSAQAGAKTVEKYQSESANLNELSIAMGQSAPQWPAGSLVVWESLSQIAFNQENVFAKFSRKAIGIWRSARWIRHRPSSPELLPRVENDLGCSRGD
jgi:KaiC/GvpD/RAD55 family RecA-like ATPase